MKNKIQNINEAISRGIKLGIDLCDETFLDNENSLENDIQQSKKEFKDLVLRKYEDEINQLMPIIYKAIGTNIHIDIEHLDVNNFPILKALCYENKIYDKIYKVKSARVLRGMIMVFENLFGNHINLNWIDVSGIKEMRYWDDGEWCGVFEKLLFDGNISRWDVSKVQDMSLMFFHSHFNGDISLWDVSNVLNMREMFEGSKFNGDISQWDVSNVYTMMCMFKYSKFNGDISQWDVSNVQYTFEMFKQCDFNKDISNWKLNPNIFKIKENKLMFEQCPIPEKFKPKF